MNLQTIILDYFIDKNKDQLNSSIQNLLSRISLSDVTAYLNKLQEHAVELYKMFNDGLDESNSDLIFGYSQLLHGTGAVELNDVVDMYATLEGQVATLGERITVIEQLLSYKFSNGYIPYAVLALSAANINAMGVVPNERVKEVLDVVDRIRQYTLDHNLVSNKLQYYESAKSRLVMQTRYNSYAQQTVGHNIRSTGESNFIKSIITTIQSTCKVLIDSNPVYAGIDKMITLLALQLPGQNIQHFVKYLAAYISSGHILSQTYATYTVDVDYIVGVVSGQALSHYFVGDIQYDVRDCALMALMSAPDMDTAKKMMTLYGKNYFRYDFSHSANMAGILSYTDDSKNFIANSKIEDLAKLYPSRFFIQTMMVVKYVLGKLTDDEIQWALTHKTNSNIQHGAMLFMEVVCNCSVGVTKHGAKTAQFVNAAIRDSKTWGTKSQRNHIEKEYNLSYAMYGLYL